MTEVPPPDQPNPEEPPFFPTQRHRDDALDSEPDSQVIENVAQETAPQRQRGVWDIEAELGLTPPQGPGVPSSEAVPEQSDPQPGEKRLGDDEPPTPPKGLPPIEDIT